MRIVITGTPGTGKSKIAALLSKMLGIRLIALKDVVEKKKIYKISNKEKLVDVKLLKKTLEQILKNKKSYVVEGHLACEIAVPCDYIFVLRTHPKILRKRMLKRKYGVEKINENLLTEMLDYCVQRVLVIYGKKPVEIDTSRETVISSTKKITKIIKNKKKQGDITDYSKELLSYLKLKRG